MPDMLVTVWTHWLKHGMPPQFVFDDGDWRELMLIVHDELVYEKLVPEGAD